VDFSGFFLVDKPSGITSHDVIDVLRKITQIKKIGHAGTLDPLASGLLIVAIGREFTKKIDEFKNLDKEYMATIKLGETSDTYDAEGEIKITSSEFKIPEIKDIEKVLKSFFGEQEQMPPIFSAKKIKGQRAYNLARNQQPVNLKFQEITISNLDLINYKYPILEFKVTVSAGTYIRSLASDIGAKLGTGAYLTKLIRTSIGKYSLDNAISLKSIKMPSDLDNARIDK